jgi:transposase
MRSLMLAFRSILRQPAKRSSTTTPVRTAAALRGWLDRAETSGIGMIEGFVSQLRRDVLAVEAAVTERWSNGPVEGHVNRLRTLKRQMYGRAGVELL